MRRTSLKLLAALIGLLLVLSGCGTIGGVDVGKTVQNALGMSSFEGSAVIRLNIEAAPGAGAGKPDYSVLNGTTIQLEQIRMEDQQHLSAKGYIGYSSTKIPFQLYMEKDKLIMNFEGSANPVVMDAGIGDLVKLPLDVSSFGSPNALLRSALPLLAPYFPAPQTISADAVQATVHNEKLDLTKIHTEINGTEMPGLIRKVFANALADGDGFKAVITEVLKKMGAADQPGLMATLIENGTASGFVYDALKSSDLAESLTNQTGPLLDSTTTISTDLYVDKSKLQVRKADFDLSLGTLKNSGIKSMSISGTAEFWNVGGTVTADKLNSSSALDLGKDAKMPRFLKNLDPKSALYVILNDKVHVNAKTINMHMPAGITESSAENGEPFIKDGSTLVPVRFVSEQLGADVLWINDTRQVKITDILTGRTLLLSLGSQTAYVDGQAEQLEVPAQLTSEKTYVPVRFIAEKLGAKVDWNNDTRTVIIVRN